MTSDGWPVGLRTPDDSDQNASRGAARGGDKRRGLPAALALADDIEAGASPIELACSCIPPDNNHSCSHGEEFVQSLDIETKQATVWGSNESRDSP